MDKRLSLIFNMVEDGIGVVDVGTDHAYVPIALSKKGYKGNIFATDINTGPLEVARKNCLEAGLNNIIFLQSNGLDDIDPNLVDTIIIAGMGGDLICEIIDRAEWTMNSSYHLILQPMSKSEVLRFWLINNGYQILCEETYNRYCVISVRFSGQNTCYNDFELYVGKHPNNTIIDNQIKYLGKKKNKFFNKIYKDLKNEYNK